MATADDRILAFLKEYIDPQTGECTPTIRTIADHLHLSTSYVQQILRRLKQSGRVEAIERFKHDPDDPGYFYPAQTSNLYRVISSFFLVLISGSSLWLLCQLPPEPVPEAC